jgi:hypothetical protein
VQPTDRSQRYSEENIRNLVAAGYRVVIDPTVNAQQNLNRSWKWQEDYQPAQLKVAQGFHVTFPPQMFAVERIPQYVDYAGASEVARSLTRDEFKADQQDDAFDKQSNRLEFSRSLCGADTPAPQDGIRVYRQDEVDGYFRQTVEVTPNGQRKIFTYVAGPPKAGPLPPQAPLAPTEKVDEFSEPEARPYEPFAPPVTAATEDVDEYGVPEIGSRTEFFKTDGTATRDIRTADYVIQREYLTAEQILEQYNIVVVNGMRPWSFEDGIQPSSPKPLPPPGTMLLPPAKDVSGRTLSYVDELPENRKPAFQDPPTIWQRIRDWFNGEPSNPLIS